ncbi:reverse transcriptase [Gossypium australe]|uniref:Reverse transcriptase n=1 Tax=Gossypium australe TaxID=47621 RepID=A0A5B6WNE1_9ROSI|nr:reverse transcriptase [Gossypium australe]
MILGCPALSMSTQWTTVNQLIDVSSGTWNKKVICRIVDHEQAARIFKIPPASSRVQDMLVWRHDATGEYSVKSGYRALITTDRQPIGHNSTTTYIYK